MKSIFDKFMTMVFFAHALKPQTNDPVKSREQSIKKAILLASKWVPFDEWKVRILFMIHQISWPYECKIKKKQPQGFTIEK